MFDCDCKSSREFNGLFLLRAFGCPKLVFHWSAAWLSWPPLWWGEISFQNFRTLKLGLYFGVDFLASSELRGKNLAKMFSGYQCAEACEAFLIFQILLLLRALMWRISANIQFANFKIDFLGNQSEYRKSLTHFCSLSPTDWRCAVCLVVRASRKAGNSV